MFSKTMSKVANGVSGDGLAVRLLMAGAHKFNIDGQDVFSVQKQ